MVQLHSVGCRNHEHLPSDQVLVVGSANAAGATWGCRSWACPINIPVGHR
jgi:hypothetical protein